MAAALLVVLAAALLGVRVASDARGGISTSVYDVGSKTHLRCSLNHSSSAVEGHRWLRGGRVVQEDSLTSVQTEYEVDLEDRAGIYTCVFLPELLGRAEIPVNGTPRVTAVKKSEHATEGEAVVLKCRADAVPPVSKWVWFKLSNSEEQVIVNGSKGRFVVSSSDTHSELHIEQLDMETDPGEYVCNGTNAVGTAAASITLRVRSPLAALWPFLGIVAEVLVLVTVIFIYEKRRKPDEVLDDDDPGSAPLKSSEQHVNDKSQHVRQRNNS
ncbi:basigin [Choloepus didactylus]|uniref:basigin n=1 Tax=Choloepus didactylus TaxID=27675 RepID=UPI00189EC26F|nr:basigin [Choloepus didactylus]XP_037680115.1 basigin [Choloepus didactylus]